jgi:hypothetical protein
MMQLVVVTSLFVVCAHFAKNYHFLVPLINSYILNAGKRFNIAIV